MHLVFERSNLELVEKSSLTGGDLVVGGDNLDGVDDFDLTFNDLGLDVKGLEERGLLWVHTGGASGNGHISGGDGADSGGSLSDLGVEDLLYVSEVTVAENHTSVEYQLGANKSEVGTDDASGGVFLLEFKNSSLHEGLKRLLVWRVSLRSCP